MLARAPATSVPASAAASTSNSIMTTHLPDHIERYLDGTLSSVESARLETEIAQSPELKRKVALARTMRAEAGGVRMSPDKAPGKETVTKVVRFVGWIALVLGGLVSLGYWAFGLATSEGTGFRDVAILVLTAGAAVLLASVIAERLRSWRSDPYKDIQQ